MFCKPYGKTGKMVSAISFGGMRFDRPEEIDRNAEIVYHGYQGGINYFDTAPGYCNDKSEDIVGTAVRRMKPGTFYVSTKTFASDADSLKRDLERSLDRLGVGRIDFYHVWCIVTMDGWQQRKSVLPAVLKAKEQGLIEHVCVSSHLGGEELSQVLGDAPFEGVTLGYCAINSLYREVAVAAAGQKGLGVVAMNPLGGGIISSNAQRFAYLRGQDDRSVVEGALRFVVSHPDITSALVGFATKEHVDEALAAVRDFRPYSAARLDEIRRRVTESFDDLCTGCGYCLPCPAGIEVPRMMDSYNMKLLGNDDKAVVNRLQWHWGMGPQEAAKCTQCGLCQSRCTQKLPIIERMGQIAKLKS